MRSETCTPAADKHYLEKGLFFLAEAIYRLQESHFEPVTGTSGKASD
jgi:glyoxylate utilization-related uncharacterized protein